MPAITAAQQMARHIATCKRAQLTAYSNAPAKHPFPVAHLMQQAVSDRLTLAGTHLTTADALIFGGQFRSAVSRHYYAMYHAARAITYADHGGDDYERHSELPRKLPQSLRDRTLREAELTDARLLRNEADYDMYPIADSDWEPDARRLSTVAANFVLECEEFALTNGHV